MRPDGVVVTTPSFDQDLRLAYRVEHLSVQQLVPEPGVEAFTIPVLPRDPGSIEAVLITLGAALRATFRLFDVAGNPIDG